MLRGIANQYYLTDISKKVRANKKAMKDKGQYVEAHAPYGYKLLQEDKHKIIIDEKVAKNIVTIFDMYIDGKTAQQIANYFNSKKIKNPSRYLKMKNASNKWSSETINDILSNPFYAGNTVMNKYITNYLTKTCKKNKNRDTWIIKENTHKAIVDKKKYNKVQDIKKGKHFKRENKYQFLLKDNGKISAEMVKLHAETEFEKYRIIQERIYIFDFDELVMNIKILKIKIRSRRLYIITTKLR